MDKPEFKKGALVQTILQQLPDAMKIKHNFYTITFWAYSLPV